MIAEKEEKRRKDERKKLREETSGCIGGTSLYPSCVCFFGVICRCEQGLSN